jgi:hypothetical protein
VVNQAGVRLMLMVRLVPVARLDQEPGSHMAATFSPTGQHGDERDTKVGIETLIGTCASLVA